MTFCAIVRLDPQELRPFIVYQVDRESSWLPMCSQRPQFARGTSSRVSIDVTIPRAPIESSARSRPPMRDYRPPAASCMQKIECLPGMTSSFFRCGLSAARPTVLLWWRCGSGEKHQNRETGGCCVPHTHHTPPSGGPIGRCRREKRQRHADPWFMDEHIECVSKQLLEGAINRFWARCGLWAAWA